MNNGFHPGFAILGISTNSLWKYPISNCGKISPDGKYLFFLQDISLYGVNAEIINDLNQNIYK